MQIITEEVRAFIAHGHTSLSNARVVDFTAADGSSLGQAIQVSKGVWNKFTQLTGMDFGNDFTAELTNAAGQPILQVSKHHGADQPQWFTIECPIGTPSGTLRWLNKTGLTFETPPGNRQDAWSHS